MGQGHGCRADKPSSQWPGTPAPPRAWSQGHRTILPCQTWTLLLKNPHPHLKKLFADLVSPTTKQVLCPPLPRAKKPLSPPACGSEGWEPYPRLIPGDQLSEPCFGGPRWDREAAAGRPGAWFPPLHPPFLWSLETTCGGHAIWGSQGLRWLPAGAGHETNSKALDKLPATPLRQTDRPTHCLWYQQEVRNACGPSPGPAQPGSGVRRAPVPRRAPVGVSASTG